MDTQQASFTGWCLLELFGHQQEVGYVTTQYYGDKAMFQVDIPELPEREFILKEPEFAAVEGGQSWCPKGTKVKRSAVPARSRIINPGAIYTMNPCSEEAARLALERKVVRALILVEAPAGKMIPAPKTFCGECSGDVETGHQLSCPSYDEHMDDDEDDGEPF